jgi:hypothetical protein
MFHDSLCAGVLCPETVRWRCRWKVEKYREGAREEVLQGEGNLLTTSGANALWTALTGGALTAFNNANAHVGVGDGNGSVPTPSAADTDLTAPTNKLRKAMDATYPSVATNQVTFKATFGSGEANFAWREWGVFNASSGGTMLNHRGQDLGTKASGTTWVITVTVSLS